MTSNLNNINPEIKKNNLNINKAIGPYTKKWPWFILSCIVFMILAFFHLRYATPQYNAKAKIKLVDSDAITNPAEVMLRDMMKNSSTEDKMISDEIEILKSRRLMKDVVVNLQLNKKFFAKGRFHDTQYFPIDKAPITINFISSDSIIHKSNFSFNVFVTSDTSFDLIYKSISTGEDIIKKMIFGKNISTPIGDIVVTPNTKKILNYLNKSIYIQITSVEKVAENYKEKFKITSTGEGSKVINLSLNDASSYKAKAIINNLVEEYNRASIEAKNRKANAAANFINSRVNLIASDLSKVDSQIEQFKTGNKLTNISSEADLFLKSSTQTNQQLAVNQTELIKIKFMQNQLNEDSLARIPGNIGLADGSVNSLATKYNELLDNRDRLLKSSNEKNPIIVNLDQQLNTLKRNLEQTLNNSAQTISLQIRSLENQASKLNSKIYAVPGQVRISKDIEREQGIKESLYLYLLQKREEATIALISTTPNAQFIDDAHSNNLPVSPKKNMVYLASILIGLSIPFGVIYLNGLLDTKIHNKEDLQNEISNIPILGEIPNVKQRIRSEKELLVKKNDRSIFSESFRIIRTNFDFVKRGRNTINYNNVVFVTSTINGEGKSFFSMNLALTMANTDQKVLLIGADIRNPQIFPALQKIVKKSIPKIGLTEYLVDKSIIIGETINEYNINNIKIDILLSGKTPPNPAELLMNKRVKELFDSVSKQYDYVIVDTAPSMLVTDTLLIREYAGHTIYLTRAGYTEKNLLNFTKELNKNNKLKGMMLVVNDVKQSNFGYGAKYGYYGATEKKSWFGIKKSK